MEIRDSLEDRLRSLKDQLIKEELKRRQERELFIYMIRMLRGVISSEDKAKILSDIIDKIEDSDDLPLDSIREKFDAIRDTIFKEIERGSETDDSFYNELLEMCNITRGVIFFLLNDFYPLDERLRHISEKIDVNCSEEILGKDLRLLKENIYRFITTLRDKIVRDGNRYRDALLNFLKEVRELEESINKIFERKKISQDITHFEDKLSSSIKEVEDSLKGNNLEQISKVIKVQISRIKKIVEEKRQRELKRLNEAEKVIGELKKRVDEAEKKAHEMKREAEELEKIAMTDPLTGVFNRTAFEKRLEEDMERFRGGGPPFSLIILDMDNLKDINDSFGHDTGDKAIKEMVSVIKEVFRKNDFISRIGGDEFAIVVEGIPEAVLEERMEGFVKRLKDISKARLGFEIEISYGISSASPGRDLKDLFKIADSRMYDQKIKKKGKKNRTKRRPLLNWLNKD